MKNKLNVNVKYRLLLIIIMLFSAVLLLFLAKQKEGMHIDEYATYGLANNYEENRPYNFRPEYGVKVSAAEVLDAHLYAEEFNIRTVWENQGKNVHPPLYYLLFHVFVLFTNHFLSIKTGIILNIIFHVINIGLMWLLLKEMLCSKSFALEGTFFYAISPVVLGNVLFIRMYVLLATFVLLVTLLFVKEWDGNNKKTFYIKLCILSVCGTLTHYYFLIYLFFCCLIWGIRILYKHEWKELILFLVTMIWAGALSLLIFPYMPTQVFEGKGGEKTISSLKSFSVFIRNFKGYWETIDILYGGCLIATVIVACGFVIYRRITLCKKDFVAEDKVKRWMIIVIPCFFYLVIVTKIAIYSATRYISPMYGICIVIIMMLMKQVVTYMNVKYNVQLLAILILVGVLLNGSWKLYTWPELYLGAQNYIDIAKEYGANNECICVSDKSWHIVASYQEFIQYRNIMFIDPDNIEMLYENGYEKYEHVVMYFDLEMQKEEIARILEKMVELNPELDTYREIYTYSYNVAYFLE